MATVKNENRLLPDEVILTKIFVIRGQKVMIDRDLAELYDIETKRLKEAIRRNRSRFPEDFMFEMTSKEFSCFPHFSKKASVMPDFTEINFCNGCPVIYK